MGNRSLVLSLCGLLLAGCSETTPDVAAQGGDPVECALKGATTFTRDCYKLVSNRVVAIQHPDGGFRLFEFGETASGLVPRDGALGAEETTDGGKVIMKVGKDRYRLDVAASGG